MCLSRRESKSAGMCASVTHVRNEKALREKKNESEHNGLFFCVWKLAKYVCVCLV